MDASEMLKQLKARQEQVGTILHGLHRELDLIRDKVAELEILLAKGYEVNLPIPPALAHSLKDVVPERSKEARVPLAQRRVALLNYLREHGPASRAQILQATGIPPGSLSVLLNDPEIVSTRYGTWHVQGLPDTDEEDD